jgi:hypothetical protein
VVAICKGRKFSTELVSLGNLALRCQQGFRDIKWKGLEKNRVQGYKLLKNRNVLRGISGKGEKKKIGIKVTKSKVIVTFVNF